MANNSTSTQNTVTANEQNGWLGIDITAKGLGDTSFTAGSVSHNVVGGVKEIGVVGNTTPGNSPPTPELGYNPVTKQSEQIQAVFDSPVNSIKVGVDLFFGSENGSGEIGKWTAYDADGHIVGSSLFTNSTGSSTKEVSIQTDEPFTKIIFSALPYANQGKYVGDSSDYSITYIKYTNCAPEACDDAKSIKEDTAPNPISGNVLINDHDANGNVLNVTNAGTFVLDHGTLVLGANGIYTYTLNNGDPAVNALNDGQKLTDSFTYNISDGHGGTDSAKLTITINGSTDNRPPVACADTNTIKEDAVPNKVTGNVLSNDSDADGNTLSVANPGTVTLTYGSLVINADGTYT
jgi:VCBS repeat-containing protein